MKKLIFFFLLIAFAIWMLVFVRHKKEEIKEQEAIPTVVESQAKSSLSANIGVDSSQSLSVAADFRLRILTEPPGADVYIDNEKVGQSPFEIAVPSQSKKLRLSLSGFEDYERQVPAAKDSEGDLVWKIQLKKNQKQSSIQFYEKEISPFSIQAKAIPLSEFSDEDANEFKDIKAKFCRVQIEDKVWVRVIVGPYPSKKAALLSLKNVKTKHPDAFVSTKQKCLGLKKE